jgi:hypothetical protein
MLLPGTVRWTKAGAGAMGVQFGLLGARETFVITQIEWEKVAPSTKK